MHGTQMEGLFKVQNSARDFFCFMFSVQGIFFLGGGGGGGGGEGEVSLLPPLTHPHHFKSS